MKMENLLSWPTPVLLSGLYKEEVRNTDCVSKKTTFLLYNYVINNNC